MKKATVRLLKVVEGKGKSADNLQLMPGEFDHDRDAWASIKDSGKYILLPVFEHTVEKENEKEEA